MKKIFSTSAILLTMVPGLLSQSDSLWTLDRCIEQAISYNLGMKRQELLVHSVSHDVTQSRMELLPNLNGAVTHSLGSGRILDRGTYEWKNASVSQGELGLRTDLTLFNGLQGLNNMKMARASYQMNVEDLESMEDNLILNVMTAYLALLANQELVEVASNNVELVEKQVTRMERLVEVGNEPKGKLLEVKAQHSAARLSLTQSRNTREVSRLDLMHLLNITEQQRFEIEQPDFPEPTLEDIPPLDSVFSYALSFLPQVKSAEYGIEASERLLALRKGARSPRLYVSGLYYSNYSDGLMNPRETDPTNPSLNYPVNQQVIDNQYRQASMGLQIPFFNRWNTQTNINKAKLELQDAEYNFHSVVLEMQKLIQQYHTEARASLDNYLSAREAVANSDEVFRFAEERFRVGTGTALEMQEARNQWNQSTSEMISSRYVLIFYTRILDFYMGKPIVF